MTEADWATADHPDEVLACLYPRGTLCDRRLRLFAVACCRSALGLAGVAAAELGERLGAAERFADGLASADELVSRVPEEEVPPPGLGSVEFRLWRAVRAACWPPTEPPLWATDPATGEDVPHPWEPGQHAAESAAKAWMFAAGARVLHEVGSAEEAATGPPSPYEVSRHAAHAAHAEFAAVLRDIFGNPFHPVAFSPEWRTEAVVALARGVDGERAFERMPVLADALEDAGCDSEEVLEQCRGPNVHVRGCWVVDAVLGRD